MKLAEKIKVVVFKRDLAMKNEAFIEKFDVDNSPVVFQVAEESEIVEGTIASPDGEFVFPDGMKVIINGGIVESVERPVEEEVEETIEEVIEEAVNEEVVEEEKVEEVEEEKVEEPAEDVEKLKERIIELESENEELKKELESTKEEVEKKEEEIKEAEMVVNNFASFKKEEKKSDKKSFNFSNIK